MMCPRALRRLLLLPVVVFASLATAGADGRLIDAAKAGDLAAAKSLIKQGAPVNTRQGDGATALHWAAYRDNLDLADLLVRAGADVNATNELGVTPLWVAAKADSVRIMARLLQARALANLAPVTGGSALMLAAQHGNAGAVKALLDHGADVNLPEGALHQTALMWAIAHRHSDVVRLLLDAGADVRARTKPSRRYVLLCCQAYLGDAAGQTWVDEGGLTPLLFAARFGDIPSAQLLLAKGSQIDELSTAGTTALVTAASLGDTAFARFALSQGADPSADSAGQSALHWAVLRGDAALVEALLAYGANPDATLRQGTLQKRSEDTFAFDKNLVGATPFLLAIRNADVALMKMLAASGANINATLVDGRTALMLATEATSAVGIPRSHRVSAEGKVLEAVQFTIASGAELNATDRLGETALHKAVTNQALGVIRALAERGAALTPRNRKGQTPLALAQARPEFPLGAQNEPILIRYRAALAKWEAGQLPSAQLLRELGAVE